MNEHAGGDFYIACRTYEREAAVSQGRSVATYPRCVGNLTFFLFLEFFEEFGVEFVLGVVFELEGVVDGVDEVVGPWGGKWHR
ncbi:hypothetical protein [Corynebacterium sp. KPL1814]|uniref:hypothetical protein n=1 Tax=Corynebacterium sp. KPL1814 TaxID=1203557 RepID=UPI001E3ACA00|nr:hypothetical protein [Corynebacterium sp. KPL1814]